MFVKYPKQTLVLFLVLFCSTIVLAQNAKTESKKIYFRLSSVKYVSKDSIKAVITSGSVHGILKGQTGPVKGAYQKGMDRYNTDLGFASAVVVYDSFTNIFIRPIATSNLQIKNGDFVVFTVNIPKVNYRSILFELGCLNIFFNDVYNKPLYSFADLMYNDTKVKEDAILQNAAKDVFDIYDYLKDFKDTAYDVLKVPLTKGRYAGKSIFDAMRDCKIKDIYTFLNYVKTYPKAYTQQTWKIGETFATWVQNGAPYSKTEVKDSVLAYAKNTIKLKSFLEKNKNIIEEEDFIHTWMIDATDEPDSSFEQSMYAAKLALKYLPKDNEFGTYFYAYVEKYIVKTEYKKAIPYCDSAIYYFTKAKNNNAITALTFTKARCYYNSSLYNDCLVTLDKGFDFMNNATNNVGASTKKSNTVYYHRIKGFCYYYLNNYIQATNSFSKAIDLYKATGTFSSLQEAIYVQNYLTKIYKKQGEQQKALEIYNEQLSLYTKLNDKKNIASVLDNIADVEFKLANYKKAIENYATAKNIYLEFDMYSSAGYSQSNIGQAYWNLGSYDSAIGAHSQALVYRRTAKSFSGLGYCWEKIGKLYKLTGDKKQAFFAYDSAAYYYNLAKDTSSLRNILSSYGDVFYNDKQYLKAFDYYVKWNNLNKAAKDKSDVVNSLYWLAATAYYFNEDTSRKYGYECLALANEIGDKTNAYYANTHLGSLSYKKFEYNEGNKFYNAALNIAIEQKNKSFEAYLYRTIGSSYSSSLDFDKAIPMLQKSIALYDSLGDKSALPYCYRLLGSAIQSKGDFYDARKEYQKSIDIAYTTNSRADVGYGYSALTFLYIIQGELSKAQQVTDSTYDIFKQLGNSYQMAEAYFNMALVAEAKSDGINAIKYYTMADSIYKIEKDIYGQSTCNTNMGAVLFYQADFDASLKYFREADKLLSTIKVITEAHILAPINIGEALHYKKDYTNAEPYLAQGYKLSIDKKAGRMQTIASSFLGAMYFETKKYDQSEKYLLESFALAQKSNETDLYINSGMTLGKLYVAKSNIPKAEEYFKKTVNFTKRIDNSKYTWIALYEYGLNLYNQNQFDTAINYFKQAVEIVEHSSQNLFGGAEAKKIYNADERKVDLYNKLVAALVKINKKEEALFYANKGNVQAVKEKIEQAGIYTSDTTKANAIKKGNELLQKQNAVEQAIAKEKSKPENEQNKALIASLESLQKIAQKDYLNFINGLVKKYPEMQSYFSNTNPADFKNNMKYIPDSTLAVLYVINDNQLFIFTATKTEIAIKTIELKADLNKQADKFLGVLRNPLNVTGTGAIRLRSTIKSDKEGIKGDFKTEATNLYNILITPIKEQLKDKKNVCIIPNSKLSNIPFQALGMVSDADGQFHFLVEDHAIFYTNKIDIFSKPFEQGNIQNSFVALGNPDKTLPMATAEVKGFKTILNNAKIYLENDATETVAAEGLSNYQYVHFATHGVLDFANPQKSYLLFAPDASNNADGRLTIEKINGLNISNCNLVTLSACETAVKSEVTKGWYISPANSFLQNNVNTVVATLWKIDDEATSVLMTEFYKNIATMPKAQALRKAQETLSKNPNYSHPYFWSAFVLYGDWR